MSRRTSFDQGFPADRRLRYDPDKLWRIWYPPLVCSDELWRDLLVPHSLLLLS